MKWHSQHAQESRRNVSEIATTHSDEEELAKGDTDSHPDAGELQVDATMANLQFWCENADTLRKIKGDIKATNNRIDEADIRISEMEEKVQGLEDATRELLKLQAKMEEKLTDQVGQARHNNIRIHGIEEGSENNSTSLMVFVENLLKEKLELSHDNDLRIERVHRALGLNPPAESLPRSIVVKFARCKPKEEILQQVWRKKGGLYKKKRTECLWTMTMLRKS